MVKGNLAFENANICFRNFSGKEGKFNPAGRRNFCVLLDTDQAVQLQDAGWNVRYLHARSADEEDQPYLQVAVSFANFPPDIYLVTSQSKTKLTEETIDLLDWAEIESVDLIIRPYNYEVNGKTGVKAYAKDMYVTISEDNFAAKYADVPDSAYQSVTSKND